MDGSRFYGSHATPPRWWQRRLPLGRGMLLMLAVAAVLLTLAIGGHVP